MSAAVRSLGPALIVAVPSDAEEDRAPKIVKPKLTIPPAVKAGEKPVETNEDLIVVDPPIKTTAKPPPANTKSVKPTTKSAAAAKTVVAVPEPDRPREGC